jgi:hypothetical protein
MHNNSGKLLGLLSPLESGALCRQTWDLDLAGLESTCALGASPPGGLICSLVVALI